ncbi:MAG TPA: hypothetical protein VFN76_09785 [Candidatus Limnocylindria bacterium]|nr:hypothetical protein [Candidatus Limnocylindria bacterium]
MKGRYSPEQQRERRELKERERSARPQNVIHRGMAALAKAFGMVPDPRVGREFYDPGASPRPRRREFVVTRPQTPKDRAERRIPRAQRLAMMAEAGVERPSGRQWKKLRKRRQRAVKAARRAAQAVAS